MASSHSRQRSPPSLICLHKAPELAILRFEAEKNAQWTSGYGVRQAAALKTRPFIALNVPASDFPHSGCGKSDTTDERYLFMISPQKPQGLIRDFYVALAPAKSSETRVFVVNPPLHAEGEQLYIYTAPTPNFARVWDAESLPDVGEKYLFDHENYTRFLQYATEDLLFFKDVFHRNPTLKPVFTEDEHYGAGWSSWNGRRQTDSRQDASPFLDFEKLTWDDHDPMLPPKLFKDLALYQQ